jgi:S-adenosylmethionine synthetase
VLVDTFGTGSVADDKIEKAVKAVFGLKPEDIIRDLDLLRPIYEPTSAYGHFGRNRGLDKFTWERKDKVEDLLAAI